MARRLALLFVVAASGLAAAEVRAFWWSEGRDPKTEEKFVGFYLATTPVMRFYEAMAKDDEAEAARLAEALPKDAWSYVLILNGDSSTFGVDQLMLREGTICGDFPKLESGTVTADPKSHMVKIALKVLREGKVVDFEGNGTYTVSPAPKK